MRFMVMVKATKDSEAGVLPDEKILTAMGKFNEELVKAGVMLAGEGLQASITPAFTSSSLNFPISARSFSSGRTPASESDRKSVV